ncbi:MAG: FHA domain-containing protein, partial [Waterburya sp.]
MPEIIIIDTRKPQETKAIMVSPESQPNQECLLGRDERCCIVLNDSLASRTHGKIAFRNGSYYFSDLGSKNGSKINNQDAQLNQEYLLKPSDTITVGNHLLWMKAIAGMQVAPPPQPLAPAQYMPLANIDIDSLETWTQGTKQVECVRIINETADVKTFTFISDPPVKFTYQPGQYITLNLNINGNSVKHFYFLSSSPSRPHSLEITVKKVVNPTDEPNELPGSVSNWLYDNLKVGSQIEIEAPTGKFTIFANPAAKVLFISAGNGITPMMSMSRWIFDTVSNVDIVFLHSARSPEDIIFRQELEMMTTRYPNFKLAFTVTRPTLGQSWYGYTGRINETILPAIAPDYLERTVYVCGLNSFMEATKNLLQNLNFPMENYYEESFGGKKQKQKSTPTVPAEAKTSILPSVAVVPPPPAVATPVLIESIVAPTSIVGSMSVLIPATPASKSSTSIVVLVKSGQEIPCDGEEAILDVAEAEGADLPFGCRRGVCGACNVKKLEGKVIYDDDVNCEEGYILTC